MSIGHSLSRLVLKRLVDDVFATGGADGLDAVIDFLTRCGSQTGEGLTAVLQQALDRAWRATEVALADDPLWNRGRAGLAPGDAQAFRGHLHRVLTELVRGGANLRLPGATAVENALRRQSLEELRAVREAGALAEGLDADEWARSNEVFIRFTVAQDRRQRGTEGEFLRALEEQGCVALMRVLTASGSLPFLVSVIRAFACQGFARLLRYNLQECPEQTPDNCPLALAIFHELSIPRFSTGRSAMPLRKRTTAMRAVPGPPIPLIFPPARRTATARKPRSKWLERKQRTLRRIPWQWIAYPARPRLSWIMPVVLALGVALILALPIWLLIVHTRQRSDERRQIAVERQRLTAERRQLDEERQRQIDEQKRQAWEEETRLQMRERQRREEDRRQLAEAEEIRRQAEERAAREAEAERRQRREEVQARLREQQEKKTKARVVFERGLTHAACRHDEQALAAFTEALQLDPGLPGAWTERGLVRQRLRDSVGALVDFAEAIRREPRDLRAWLPRGELHVARHDYSLAIEDFTAVIRLEPRNALAYRERGACSIQIGNLDNALADETTALDLAPRDPWPYFYRADIHQRRHDLDRAFADYSAAIDRDPGNDSGLAPVYRARGTIYLDRQEYASAIVDLTRALEFDSADVAARQARGLAYMKLGDWDNVSLDAGALIRHDPDNGEGYKMRGQAQLALRQYDKAHADFTRLIRRHRADAEVYYLRARVKVQLGDIDEAIYDCNCATSSNPRLANAFYLRGTLRLQGGNRARGLEDRQKAHEINPLYPLP